MFSAQKKKIDSKGFTLIELLIVIVIIGILAGVAISVIDPKKQQDRAHDASIKATINKASLSTEGYVSAYGGAPSPAEFINGLKNYNPTTETCTSSTNNVSCEFTIEGNSLPATCDSSTWYGSGTTQCLYHYERNDPDEVGADTTQFFIYAKSFGLSTSVFKYDNTRGVILACDEAAPTNDTSCTE